MERTGLSAFLEFIAKYFELKIKNIAQRMMQNVCKHDFYLLQEYQINIVDEDDSDKIKRSHNCKVFYCKLCDKRVKVGDYYSVGENFKSQIDFLLKGNNLPERKDEQR